MNRTKIEWVKNPDGTQGYTINPIKGKCPMACSYCYARRMYKRFKWNETIRFDNRAFLGLDKLKKPSRIFISSTMELFGEWVTSEMHEYTFRQVKNFPQHTFLFLTKQPQNLAKFSPFPSNCWVGFTATNSKMLIDGLKAIRGIKASKTYISFEPLLSRICDSEFGGLSIRALSEELARAKVNQLIIGQQTPIRPGTTPKTEWIEEIEEAAKKAGVVIFEKDNLASLLKRPLRQELPYWDKERIR